MHHNTPTDDQDCYAGCAVSVPTLSCQPKVSFGIKVKQNAIAANSFCYATAIRADALHACFCLAPL